METMKTEPQEIQEPIVKEQIPSQTEIKLQELKPTEDLIKRVSGYKKPETTTEPKKEGDVDFNFKDLESIKSSDEAKLWAEKAYKSMQSGWNKKYQDVAEMRKHFEQQMNQFSNWTPERIQGLLNDPKFVEAAQQVAQSKAPLTWEGSQQEWSNLSDAEKAKFQVLENKVSMLERQNFQAMRIQEDEKLKTKYADYASDIVDTTINDLMSGKVQASREDIWKVINYEKDIHRAYQLGKEDRESEKSEKINSMSIDGGISVNSSSKPTPEKGETDTNFFRRLVADNMKKMNSGQMRK